MNKIEYSNTKQILCFNKPKKIGEAKFLAGSWCQPGTISKSLPIRWFRRIQIYCVEDSLDVSMFNEKE